MHLLACASGAPTTTLSMRVMITAATNPTTVSTKMQIIPDYIVSEANKLLL
jgi:hypothetical protein